MTYSPEKFKIPSRKSPGLSLPVEGKHLIDLKSLEKISRGSRTIPSIKLFEN